MEAPKKKVIALEARLRRCRNVLTLGVRPNFWDYPEKDAEAIRRAEKIYYPSSLYADMFAASGKQTFPASHTYSFAQDKIRQTVLFSMLGIPHPKTRIYYGRCPVEKILADFDFPLVAKVPRGSSMGRGVFLVRELSELERYCAMNRPAYIQEYIPIQSDFRIVVIGFIPVLAYRRIPRFGDFRCNVSLGAKICFSDIDSRAVRLAVETVKACGFDDAGIDICKKNGGRYLVLEANMKYGRQGFSLAGIDYNAMMEELIEDGKI